MAETPEEKYNRIAAAVRRTILENFPNPDRVGCPGDGKVREVASRRTILEDDDWQHITHCSPCYAEFLEVKEEVRRSGTRARTLGVIGGATVMILLAALFVYRYLAGSGISEQTANVTFEPATLNLSDSSVGRGGESADQKSAPLLPRRPLDLTIVLPFGSEPGAYQFQLLGADGRVMKTGDAIAKLRNGSTSLNTRIDAAYYPVGDYRIGFRQQSFKWAFHPVRFR
jgi:hypothetical protein